MSQIVANATAHSAANSSVNKPTGKRVVIVGVAVIVCGSLAWFTAHAHDRLAALPKLRTVAIERRDLRITIATTGTVEPLEVVEVGAMVAGKITGLAVDPEHPTKLIDVGTRVKRDSVVLQLDNQSYQVALRKAQAARTLASAETQRLTTKLQQTARELERAQRLRATNSESDFDKSFTAHEMAKAELAVAQARYAQTENEVAQAQINLARTTIRSPIDGVVIDRRANLGQSVGPGSGGGGLFLLAQDLNHMQVRASVSETDIGKIYVDQPVTFTVDAHRDTVMSGRVESIMLNARVNGNFVTYDVLVRVDGTTEMLLPHMTADVQFETVKRENAFLVPSESLRWWPTEEQMAQPPANANPTAETEPENPPAAGDSAFVWVPAGQGKVKAISVQVGVDDGVQTEVIGDGFKAKMPVVVGAVKETVLARIIPSVKTLN